MKKVLFVAVAMVAAISFSSCKKTCTCTNSSTGQSEKVKTDKDFKTCEDIEDALNEVSYGLVKWSCK